MPRQRKGCLGRCLRWVCCCYCCCKVTRCCFRTICCCKEWCAAPRDDLDDKEAVVAEDRGLTGKGALSTALRSSPAPPLAAGASKWKVNVSSTPQQVEGAKTAAASPGVFSKLFGSPTSSTSTPKIKGMPMDEADDEDWQSMTNSIITRKAPSASAAALPPSPNEEEDKVIKSPVAPEEEAGAPILTLKDLNKFRGRVEGAGSPSGDTPPVPILPTPGQSQFVSHRDNLKLLESRRIQKEKRDEKKGSNTYLSKVKAGSAATPF